MGNHHWLPITILSMDLGDFILALDQTNRFNKEQAEALEIAKVAPS